MYIKFGGSNYFNVNTSGVYFFKVPQLTVIDKTPTPGSMDYPDGLPLQNPMVRVRVVGGVHVHVFGVVHGLGVSVLSITSVNYDGDDHEN